MFLPDQYEFFCPVKINSGNKALDQLPYELCALGSMKPLVLTKKDRRLASKLISALKESGVTIGIFDALSDTPGMKEIEKLADIYHDGEHTAIIALGDGSTVDAAKVLNIVVSYNSSDIRTLAGDDHINDPLKPFVFIPSLSGSGYETTRFAFMEDMVFSSYFLMPDLVIIDTRLIRSESIQTTVSTAMAALAHAVEAYTCPAKNPLTDTYAYPAIQYIMENLLTVIKKPRYTKGRLALVNAACMAGCAFSNITAGMVHRLGETVGEMFRLPAGLCMGVLLPYCLDYYSYKEGYHVNDVLLPLAGHDEYAVTASNFRASRSVTMLYDLQHDLYDATGGEIPRTLAEADIPKYMLGDIVEKIALKEPSDLFIGDCQVILDHAWEGRPISWS
jgi:alcohol dehydrogenase